MLSKNFWDSASIWPFAAWPLLAAMLSFDVIYFNTRLISQGTRVEQIYSSRISQSLYFSFMATALIFEPLSFAYSCWIFGWRYVPVTIAGVFLSDFTLRPIIGFMPYSHIIGPLAYLFCTVCFLVLIGVFTIPIVANLNVAIATFLVHLAPAYPRSV